MPEEDQRITVRRLPDGDSVTAAWRGLDDRTLRIDLDPLNEAGLKRGDLVEVACPKTIYLGEVRGREGETTIVSVEHALELESLALLQQIWRDPVRPDL